MSENEVKLRVTEKEKQRRGIRGSMIAQNCGIEIEVIGNIHDNPELIERDSNV